MCERRGMDIDLLFSAALGLLPPWKVVKVSFDAKAAEGRGILRMEIDFEPGARFPCSDCGEASPAHDTSPQEWRHLDFFQHETYLTARVPRVGCKKHGVRKISMLPWARADSGFTLLFEAYIMLMAPEMPMKALARAVREHDTRLWRLVTAHVNKARENVDMSEVTDLVVDETSQARGHEYVTIFVEPKKERKSRVLFVTQGRSHGTFSEFCSDLKAHGGNATKVKDVCMDMSPAFMKGAAETMPDAEVTFDRFHVMKLAGEAVDEVRRTEQRQQPELKGTRYTWLKNPENLTGDQYVNFVRLSQMNLKTTTAYHMRPNLAEVWNTRDVKTARRLLGEWCGWVHRACRTRKGEDPSGLEPMRAVAKTVKKHRRGILNYFRKGMTSAVIEGFNSLVQAARARARGYRSVETFKTMIYLIGGRLTYDLPVLTTS